MEYLEEERPRVKAKGRNKTWIQDDPENIVDLADVSSARRITGEKREILVFWTRLFSFIR